MLLIFKDGTWFFFFNQRKYKHNYRKNCMSFKNSTMWDNCKKMFLKKGRGFYSCFKLSGYK